MLEKCRFFCWLDSPFIFPYVRFCHCSMLYSPLVCFGYLNLKTKLHLLVECKEISTKLITLSETSTPSYIFMAWCLIKHGPIYRICALILWDKCVPCVAPEIPLKATTRRNLHLSEDQCILAMSCVNLLLQVGSYTLEVSKLKPGKSIYSRFYLAGFRNVIACLVMG
jgi:hypothetical protein